jgi:hypothetical protein
MYYKQWQRYRSWFPQELILSITTEELSTQTQSSLRRILSFIGATPDCSELLEKGQLPLMNPAGSKGRNNVAAPSWSDELKQKTIDLIRPDSERFLASTGRPLTTWAWD